MVWLILIVIILEAILVFQIAHQNKLREEELWLNPKYRRKRSILVRLKEIKKLAAEYKHRLDSAPGIERYYEQKGDTASLKVIRDEVTEMYKLNDIGLKEVVRLSKELIDIDLGEHETQPW